MGYNHPLNNHLKSTRFLVTLVIVHPMNARDVNGVLIIHKIVGVLATTIWVLSPMWKTHVLSKDKTINLILYRRLVTKQ